MSNEDTGATATITNTCSPVFTIVLLEYIDERYNNSRTAAPQGVPDGNRASVHIDLFRIERD